MTHTNAADVKKGEGLGLFDLKIHVLPEGYRFNLHERCPVVAKKYRNDTGEKRSSAKG